MTLTRTPCVTLRHSLALRLKGRTWDHYGHNLGLARHQLRASGSICTTRVAIATHHFNPFLVKEGQRMCNILSTAYSVYKGLICIMGPLEDALLKQNKRKTHTKLQPQNGHILPILHTLHWLPVTHRIQYNISTTGFSFI